MLRSTVLVLVTLVSASLPGVASAAPAMLEFRLMGQERGGGVWVQSLVASMTDDTPHGDPVDFAVNAPEVAGRSLDTVGTASVRNIDPGYIAAEAAMYLGPVNSTTGPVTFSATYDGATAKATAPMGLTLAPGAKDGVFTGTTLRGATVAAELRDDTAGYGLVVVAPDGTFTLDFRTEGFSGALRNGTTVDLQVTVDGGAAPVTYMQRWSASAGAVIERTGSDQAPVVTVLTGDRVGEPVKALGRTSYHGYLTAMTPPPARVDVELVDRTFTVDLVDVTIDAIDVDSASGEGPPNASISVTFTTDAGLASGDVLSDGSGAWSATYAGLGGPGAPSKWAKVGASTYTESASAFASRTVGLQNPAADAAPAVDVDLANLSVYLSDVPGTDGDAVPWTFDLERGGTLQGSATLTVVTPGSSSLTLPFPAAPADLLGGGTLRLEPLRGGKLAFTLPPTELTSDGGVTRVVTEPGFTIRVSAHPGVTETSNEDADGVFETDLAAAEYPRTEIWVELISPDASVHVHHIAFTGFTPRDVAEVGGHVTSGDGLFLAAPGATDLVARIPFSAAGLRAPLPGGAAALSPPLGVTWEENGAVTRRPSVRVDAVIGLTSSPQKGEGDLHIGIDGPFGWEAVPADHVTWCLDATTDNPDVCLLHPPPFAFVDDVPHFSSLVVTQGVNPAGATLDLARAAGGTRIDTAVELSKAAFADGAADAVVVARADAFPDALASVPVAAAAGGPVLLNTQDDLDDRVAAEITRLGASRVYVMGGEVAQSPAVTDALATMIGSSKVTRLGGDDRFETAAIAATAAVDLWEDAGLEVGPGVLVAKGNDPEESRAWPDALAGGQLAAHSRQPILLTAHDRVPDVTNDTIAALGATSVTALGGDAAIPSGLLDAMGGSGVTRSRIGGQDRFETSTLIADAAVAAGATDRDVIVATGRNFPDGLAAGAAAAARGGVTVLVDDDDLVGASAAAEQWLGDRVGVTRWVRIAGGDAAVRDAVVEAIRALLT